MADLNSTLVRGNLRVTSDTDISGNTSVGFIHSNAAASTTSVSTIPDKSAIALETGNGDGNVSSWIWRENWSSANFGIFHDNSANMLKFVGDGTSRLSVGLSSNDPNVYVTSKLYTGPTVIDAQGLAAPLIVKNGAYGNYDEGIRVMPSNSWAGILLAGNNATESSGTSSTSWVFGNANGNLHITKNGSTGDGSASFKCVNNEWSFSTLVKTSYNDSHRGIKVGNTYINAINSELILQNNGTIRFGADDWDYNKWAGLKYDATNKIVYLGVADGSIFTANSAQTGTLKFPGIVDIESNAIHAASVADSLSPNAAAIEVREYNRGGNTISEVYNHAPRIGFHWQNRYWANMAYINDEFHFLNNNCNAYRPVRASSFYENDVALSSKYLQLSGGNVTGVLDASTLKENGVLLTTKYALKTELPQIDDLTGI